MKRKLISATAVTAVALGLTLSGVGPAGAAITSPASGAVLKGTVTFSDSGVGDGTGCLSGTSPNVKFSLINSANATVWTQTISSTGAVTSGAVVTQSYPNGNYTLRADEQKRSGFLYCTNSTSTVNQAVSISNVSDIVLTSPSVGAQNTSAAVSAKLTDPNLGTEVLAGKTVTFSIPGGGSVNAVTNASGIASANLPLGGPPRTAAITANFAGDAYYVGKSANASITVDRDASSTTVAAPNAVVHGEATSFSAHVAATEGTDAPTGTVQFTVDGNNFGAPVAIDASGNASSSSTSTLSTGSHAIVAAYSGDANIKPSTSASKAQVVNKAGTTTALTRSPGSPTKFGQAVTFTATVSVVAPGVGSPTGAVQFNVDGQPYGTAVPLTGNHASVTISNLHQGNHDIDATYNGDADFTASSGATLTQGIDKSDTNVTLATSDASAVSGEPLTYTAKVTPVSPGAGNPSGTVTFYADGHQIGSPVPVDGGGNATSDQVGLLVGPHAITANYSGDGDFAGGSASYTQNVAAAQVATALTVSPNPSVFGQEVTLHAAVSAIAPATGHPTGAVKFVVDGQNTYVDLDNGVADMTISTLGVGSHTIKAVYLSDDPNFIAGTNDTATQVVNKAASKTTVTTSGSPSVIGQPVTFTAHVAALAPGAGNPSGTITFTDGSDVLGTVDVDSSTGEQGSITVSDLAVSTHAITATFSGDGNFNGSNGSVVQVVKRGQSSTVVTSSANPAQSGQSVKFTATVTPVAPAVGDPGGTVTFTINGMPFGTPVAVVDGVAVSSKFASLSPGTYKVVATYSGDANFQSSVGSLDQGNGQNVAKGATAMNVTTDGSPAAYGAPVTFTATVDAVAPATGSPSGLVQFWEDGVFLGAGGLSASGLNSSVATFVSSTLGQGTHAITAVYVGNFNFDGTTASVAQTIANAPSVTGVTAVTNPITFGDSAQLVATVAPAVPAGSTPTGSVTFKEGSTVLGTANLAAVDGSQKASLTVPGWHGGGHAVTATYSGDGSFATSTSAPYTVNVDRAASTVTAEQLIGVKDGDLNIHIGYLRATVRGLGGQPLAGQTVQFTTTKVAGGDVVGVCTAVTDNKGFAQCSSSVVNVLREIITNGYEANYVGNADYLPATDHGSQL